MQAWVNGRMLSAPGEPALTVLDHGLVVGDGAFETIKTVDQQPFALTRHLRRLERSLAGLGLVPPNEAYVREAIDAVLAADAREGAGKVRVTVTGGPSPLSSDRGDAGPSVFVVSDALGSWDDTTAVATVPWPRNERGATAGLKTTSYAENVVALAYAHERAASEAVLANTAGQLCEGTGSNVFVVVDGELCTPSLAAGCLDGITRQLVLEWTDAVERDLSVEVLATAEEVFVTSSTRDVQAVHAVDDRRIDAPGPVTTDVVKVFAERSAETVDP